MKYGCIVERITDFECGECYAIVSNDEIKDCFLCTNIDTAAKHYLTYTVRGCEIWKYMNKDVARDKIDELSWKRDEIYQLFANGNRSASSNIAICCEIATTINRLKKIFYTNRERRLNHA